jgi:hypothetical protein
LEFQVGFDFRITFYALSFSKSRGNFLFFPCSPENPQRRGKRAYQEDDRPLVFPKAHLQMSLALSLVQPDHLPAGQSPRAGVQGVKETAREGRKEMKKPRGRRMAEVWFPQPFFSFISQ